VTVNGEITNPPEIDAGLAAAALAVFGHRHEVVHLLYAAVDEPDALRRIAGLLHVDEATIARVLDQPLRWMLPQFRSELETIAATVPPGLPARAGAGPAASRGSTPDPTRAPGAAASASAGSEVTSGAATDAAAVSSAAQEARTSTLGSEAGAADLEHTSAAPN
jgi:hypothetical protein